MASATLAAGTGRAKRHHPIGARRMDPTWSPGSCRRKRGAETMGPASALVSAGARALAAKERLMAGPSTRRGPPRDEKLVGRPDRLSAGRQVIDVHPMLS